MKDVASYIIPQGGARSLRSEGFRIGILSFWMISNDRKRGKLKRLSIRRKRNQTRCCKNQRKANRILIRNSKEMWGMDSLLILFNSTEVIWKDILKKVTVL